MGLTEFFSVCLFLAAVALAALLCFWLVSEAAKRGTFPPIVVKIAVAVIAAVGLAAVALRYAGGVVPR